MNDELINILRTYLEYRDLRDVFGNDGTVRGHYFDTIGVGVVEGLRAR